MGALVRMQWGLEVTRIGDWKTVQGAQKPSVVALSTWRPCVGPPCQSAQSFRAPGSVGSSLPLSSHSVRLASWSEGPSCLFLLYPSQKILPVNILHLISHLGVHSSEDLNSAPSLLSPPLWAAATSFLVKVNHL